MRLFEDFKIKFEKPDWSRSPELGLIDTILEQHPHLVGLLAEDFTIGKKPSAFGRKDTPSMEQIVRAAIYKELKGLEYRELEFHQTDSRICAAFLKIDELRPYSFQVYQKYISRIKADNLQKLLVELNKIAISAGIEDIERIRQDSTVVETNIHHPTNNSILWDCIKEAYRLLGHLSEEVNGLKYQDYTKQGKKTYFKINNTKGDKRKDLFSNQLVLFLKTINQVSNVIKKKPSFGIKATILATQLEEHIEVMQLVYDMAYLKEIKGEKVPNEEKIYSIYERHTDIIVKGSRDIKFGHKVDFSSGKSNLVLNCQVLRGNPSDSTVDYDFVQFAMEAIYRMGKQQQWFLGARYSTVANKETSPQMQVSRVQFAGGWFMTKNVVMKLEYVDQKYENFTATYGDKAGFSGFMLEAGISF
jgi:IS5 family transposase